MTLFPVYCAVNVPFEVPYVYVGATNVPPPVNFQPSNAVVCICCNESVLVPPFVLNLTVYPLGVAVGFDIVFVVPYPCPKFCDVVFPFQVPPFGFTVNVYFITSQLAFNVIFVDISTVVVSSIFVVSLYQPLNIFPVFVGVGNVPYVPPFITFFVVGLTFPPSGSNVTVYSLPNHLAVNVVLLVIFTISLSVTFVLPLYQPSNV